MTEVHLPSKILNLYDAYDGRVVDYELGEISTGERLRRLSERLASILRKAGVSPGDVVVLRAYNGAGFFFSFAAILMVAACPLPVFAGAVQNEIDHLAQVHGVRWLLDATRHSGADSLEPADDWLKRLTPAFDRPPLPEGMPLHMTSGSTGKPKLAARPSRAAIAEANHYAATLGINRDDTIHCVTPLSHAYAFGMGFMTPLLTGADLVTTRSFNPRLTCRILAENGATILPVAPATLPLIARSGLRNAGYLRHLLTAGAPLHPPTAAAFQRETGIAPRPLFGTTETGGISVSMSVYRSFSVGQPMDGVTVEICDFDKESGVGRLKVRSPSMMTGYLGQDGRLTGLEPSGWFKTDDLAVIAEDGEIELRGRVSDVVNVAGFKIMPREVETIIATMPQVIEVKAYRARSLQHEEILAVAVVASERLDPASVQDVCLAMMAKHKCPAAIHVLDDLPRLSNGKISVGDLPSAMGYNE